MKFLCFFACFCRADKLVVLLYYFFKFVSSLFQNWCVTVLVDVLGVVLKYLSELLYFTWGFLRDYLCIYFWIHSLSGVCRQRSSCWSIINILYTGYPVQDLLLSQLKKINLIWWVDKIIVISIFLCVWSINIKIFNLLS